MFAGKTVQPFAGNLTFAFPKAWNPYLHGGYISLFGSNLQIACTSQSMVIGTPLLAINPGDHKYWEITSGGGTMGIGVSLNPTHITNNLGDYTDSWGYVNFSGTSGKAHNVVISGALAGYGAPYVAADVIGVEADYTSGTCTLTFYKNGVSQGVAYSGISGVLFPASGSFGSIAFQNKANFVGPITSGSLPSGASFF